MSGGSACGARGTGAECRKFAPNIFNKSKCSSCFKQKEEHSAEALECNRVSLVDGLLYTALTQRAQHLFLVSLFSKDQFSFLYFFPSLSFSHKHPILVNPRIPLLTIETLFKKKNPNIDLNRIEPCQ